MSIGWKNSENDRTVLPDIPSFLSGLGCFDQTSAKNAHSDLGNLDRVAVIDGNGRIRSNPARLTELALRNWLHQPPMTT